MVGDLGNLLRKLMKQQIGIMGIKIIMQISSKYLANRRKTCQYRHLNHNSPL